LIVAAFSKNSLARLRRLAALVRSWPDWRVLTNPLRRKGLETGIRITTLDSLPADGVPRKFP